MRGSYCNTSSQASALADLIKSTEPSLSYPDFCVLKVTRADAASSPEIISDAGSRASLVYSDAQVCKSVLHVVDDVLLPKPTAQ